MSHIPPSGESDVTDPRRDNLFESAGPKSRKLRCKVCGRTGWETRTWGTEIRPWSWMAVCARGHAPCRKCGRMLAVLQNGKGRSHSRCPQRRAAA